MKIMALASAALVASAIGAPALTYNYSYTFTGGQTVTGSLEGNLQGDNNTILVTSASTPSLDGVAHSAGVSTLYGNYWLGSTPTVTLDGSFLDFSVADPGYNEGYYIQTATNTAYVDQGLGISIIDVVIPSQWSIETAVAPVPLPATGLMLLAGLSGIAATRRRRKAA